MTNKIFRISTVFGLWIAFMIFILLVDSPVITLILALIIVIVSVRLLIEEDENIETSYRYAILVLLARVMSADGRQMKCELDVVKSVIRKYYITNDEQKAALKQFQSILNNIDKYKKYNLSKICNPINEHFQYNNPAKSELINDLLTMAYADKERLSYEVKEISNIVNHLEFSLEKYMRLLNIFKKRYEQKESKNEYEQEKSKTEHKEKSKTEHKGKSETNSNNSKDCNFRDSILQLLAEVMKADGKQMKCELDRVKATIRRYYKTENEQRTALKQFQDILNSQKISYIKILCNVINKEFDYAAKSELIMELLAVAYADDDFSEIEESTINNIVLYLRISRNGYKSIMKIFRKKYEQGEYKYNEDKDESYNEYNKKWENENKNRDRGNSNNSNNNRSQSGNISVSEAYDILGVEGNASDAEIKKAYRVLAMMYHPDKFASLGDEAVRQATESMKQINAAWETVKSERGMR